MEYVEEILTVKISAPRIGVETIWRQRLLENFHGYEYKKLTIVSAATGYGKTVLISQFASKVKSPVVWYQVDNFDNDLNTFIRYFIASISRKIPHFALQTLDFINQHKDISKYIHTVVILLTNELEVRAKEGLIFVFDDYHLINEILIHKFMEEFIEYLPEAVHFVISSRYKLPFKLVRLESHGLINEIRYNHLKFNENEIRSFLDSYKSSDISEEILEKVKSETGGWAVALSLIKDCFLEKKNNRINLDLMQWRNREKVYKYLAEEVFNGLPELMQTFLINTSILDVITPNICSELFEQKGSKEILESLMKRNIFLIKIEGEEEAYRYHHLFRDFLQKRLGEKKKILLEKAAQYYLNKEDFQQGIEYYMEAELYEKAVLAIEKIGIDMLKFGKWQTVSRWIKKIPNEFIKNSAYFMLLNGVMFSHKKMWNEALTQLNEALNLFLLYGNQEDILNTRFQKAIVLRKIGQVDESLELLNEILSSVNTLSILKWYDVVLEKVNSLLWNGYLNEAVNTLKQGIKFAQDDEEHGLIAYFMEHLGATYFTTGDYYKAVEFYRNSTERYLQVYNPLSEIEKERYSQRTTLARIYRDWGELDKALELIREEIEIKERLGLIEDLPRAYHQLALICNDYGEKEEAEKHFQHADELYEKLDRRDFQWTWHMALYGKILMDNGKHEKGKVYIEKAINFARGNSEFNLAVCEFVGCYVYIDSGQICKAIQLIEHALDVGKKVGAKNLICQCYWVLSNIYSNMGNEEKAKDYAIQCFALARAENYLQIFLSYKTTSFPIIKLGIEMGIEEEYLEKIILKLGNKSQEMLLELMQSNKPDINYRAKQLLLKVGGKELILNEEILSETLNEKTQEDELMRVYCFGHFEVMGKDDLEPVQWKTTKAKEVFAYLIKNANKTINKEKILEDIWPEMNSQQTSMWLHTYIYQIRKVMKHFGIKKGLIYQNNGYRLVNKGIISDVDKFKSIVNQFMQKEENHQHKIKYLEEAISLYKGEYMEGFYNEWIMEEKHNLEGIYLSALERLTEIYIEAEEYNPALNCLEKMIKINPLLEKAYEMSITIYGKTGDRIAATNQYEYYCKILKNELDIEPKIQIKNLYNKLMTDK